MMLRYSFKELFRGKIPVPTKLYEILEDLASGVEPKLTVKKDVKLTKKDLVKAFGKNFDSIGVIHNSEGSYLVVASGDSFKHVSLDKI